MTWGCRGLGLPGGHVCANAARSSLHSAHVAPIVGRLAALPNLDRHQIPMNTSTPHLPPLPETAEIAERDLLGGLEKGLRVIEAFD